MNWPRVILGAICGVVATGPMTAAMVLWHRRLPARERYPLPPREITGEVADRAGLPLTPGALSAATWMAHFAYGGGAGGLYGALPPHRLGSPALLGTLLGLAVWSLSYFGLLPALRILRPPTQHPVRRSALMLGAHFVWGICLAALHRLLLEDAERVAPALRERAVRARDTYPRNGKAVPVA
jgi:hypothetical protein